MQITPGRVVNYKFGEDFLSVPGGNSVKRGDVYPAIIVRVWNQDQGTCNLVVFTDGPATYWATSRIRGDKEGQWSWPVRAQDPAEMQKG